MKNQDQQQRFGLRKLSTGMASVLLAVAFLGYGTVAHADAQPASNEATTTTTAVQSITNQAGGSSPANNQPAAEAQVAQPNVSTVQTSNPAQESKVTVHFQYSLNHSSLDNAQTVHEPVTVSGQPGAPITPVADAVKPVVQSILNDHPDWYIASGISTLNNDRTFPIADFSDTITFLTAQKYNSVEMVFDGSGSTMIAKGTTQAQYNNEIGGNSTGENFRNWTEQTFESQTLPAKNGHPVFVTRVKVNVASTPSAGAWPFITPDKDGKSLQNYADELQSQLDKWLRENPYSSTLPTYTIKAPMDVTFTVSDSVTSTVGRQIDVHFPANAGSGDGKVDLNQVNPYYYREADQKVSPNVDGTWPSVSYGAQSLSDALQDGTYTNAQTGHDGQTLPSFDGYTPYISGVVVTGAHQYSAQADKLLDELDAAIRQNPYEVPAYALDFPFLVSFHVNYALTDSVGREIHVHFPENAGSGNGKVDVSHQNPYYYKEAKRTVSSKDNGQTWSPVSYDTQSLSDALQDGTYTNAQTGHDGQALPSFDGYTPYIDAVVVGHDSKYSAQATKLRQKLEDIISQNPYEIPAYTLNLPLWVSFHVH